jgi:hypothetical protein
MEPLVDQTRSAWQPFTPRGVAAFAHDSLTRLLLLQFLAAALVAGVVVWFVDNNWFPSVVKAIDHLPAHGSIQAGRLNWSGDSPQLLAENRFLAIAVDLQHEGQARSAAHLQLEFGAADIWIYSLFGRLQTSYPGAGSIAFNLEDLKPWWGAWAPAILAGIALSVVVGLMASWAALACVYFLPAWLLGLYCDRQLTLCGSWRLAGAALIPGAFLMMAAIGLYGIGALDLVRFIVAWALHIASGWAFLIGGALASPKLRSNSGEKLNPFAAAAETDKPAKDPSPNPFSPSRD